MALFNANLEECTYYLPLDKYIPTWTRRSYYISDFILQIRSTVLFRPKCVATSRGIAFLFVFTGLLTIEMLLRILWFNKIFDFRAKIDFFRKKLFIRFQNFQIVSSLITESKPESDMTQSVADSFASLIGEGPEAFLVPEAAKVLQEQPGVNDTYLCPSLMQRQY